MILRRQRPVIDNSQLNKEEPWPTLKNKSKLTTNEIQAPVKTSANKISEGNEKSFHDEDEKIENVKSAKLDSVKRISRIFEKDSPKEPIDSSKNENKCEKELHVKRWDINPSSVFKEKVKTYQMLVQSTEETKRKTSEKGISESHAGKNISDEKLSSPEVLSSKKSKLLLSVEIKEKNVEESKAESSLNQEKSNVLTVNEKLGKINASELSSNNLNSTKTLMESIKSSQAIANSSQVKSIGNDIDSAIIPNNDKNKDNSSSEIKEKIKTYQMLTQNSEEKKGKDLKKKNSELSLVKNLPSEKSFSLPKQNFLISVEINEKVEIEDKTELIPSNQEKNETFKDFVNSSNASDKGSQAKLTTTLSSSSITSNKENNIVNSTSVLKDKIKAYQMLVKSTEEEKSRNSKIKNNKTSLAKKLSDEKLCSPRIESNTSRPTLKFSNEINEKIEVQNKSESPALNTEETITILESNEKLAKENETALVGSDVLADKALEEVKNISHPSENNNEMKSTSKISDSLITNNDISNDKEVKPYYQNVLEKDMPIFESRSSSVKSIINKYQTNIQSNSIKPKIETNKKVLKTQESQSKISVSNISGDVLKALEIDLIENINNDIDKAFIIDPNDFSQVDIKTLNSTGVKILVVTSKKNTIEHSNDKSKREVASDEKILPATDSVNGEKAVTFSRKEINLNKKSKEAENQTYVPNQTEESIEENKTQNQASERELSPSSSIKDIIRKAKLEAEKQQKNIQANQSKKSGNKSSAIMKSSNSPEKNKFDLNKELEKTFKSRVFHNEVVSSDNFQTESIKNISEDKDKTNEDEKQMDKQNGPVFKYKIGENSKEKLTDWTPVNEVIIKTEDEVEKEKIVKLESKPIYMFSSSELEEITYKNTQINAKVTTQGKGILKTSKPKIENEIENDSKSQSQHADNNNKSNTANLEKFIARHLEKQMQNGSNQGDSSKLKHPPLKRIFNGTADAKSSDRSAFENEESKLIPNGSVLNSDSEKDLPEPDYD